MTGEEPRNILRYTMKYADTTYARQCTYMSLLKTYSCELCELCGVDTLVRLGERNLFDCTNCIFKVTENIKYEGCPYELVSKDNLLK